MVHAPAQGSSPRTEQQERHCLRLFGLRLAQAQV